mmetsp:Transcript_21017/g.59993  ORF Transcript_21017/g.59993 Transcript_21017/m.59993 type:complete len:241 (+) Transcript_21017:1449-2171(+)
MGRWCGPPTPKGHHRPHPLRHHPATSEQFLWRQSPAGQRSLECCVTQPIEPGRVLSRASRRRFHCRHPCHGLPRPPLGRRCFPSVCQWPIQLSPCGRRHLDLRCVCQLRHQQHGREHRPRSVGRMGGWSGRFRIHTTPCSTTHISAWPQRDPWPCRLALSWCCPAHLLPLFNRCLSLTRRLSYLAKCSKGVMVLWWCVMSTGRECRRHEASCPLIEDDGRGEGGGAWRGCMSVCDMFGCG